MARAQWPLNLGVVTADPLFILGYVGAEVERRRTAEEDAHHQRTKLQETLLALSREQSLRLQCSEQVHDLRCQLSDARLELGCADLRIAELDLELEQASAEVTHLELQAGLRASQGRLALLRANESFGRMPGNQAAITAELQKTSAACDVLAQRLVDLRRNPGEHPDASAETGGASSSHGPQQPASTASALTLMNGCTIRLRPALQLGLNHTASAASRLQTAIRAALESQRELEQFSDRCDRKRQRMSHD